MVRIRPAVQSDAQFLPDIELSSGKVFHAIPNLAWVADDTVQSVERHRDLIQRGAAWIAEIGSGKIIGFLNAERMDHSLHIWQMSVHTDYQKQGVGRKLVETAKQWSVNEKLALTTLTTFRDIRWNELFYRSCGFIQMEGDLPIFLKDILAAEDAAGLPRSSRCAMAYLNI
jgi:GNAT superfamily N-acetyltransferase